MARVNRKKTPLFAKVKKAIKDADDRQVKVGFFESAKYPDGTPVAYIAAIQEFMDGGSRSFMRTTIAEQTKEWKKLMQDGAKAIINGTETVDSVLENLGLLAAAQVGEKISSIHSPPLKEATIAARKRKLANGEKVGNLTKPLVESGVLIASTTHQVE